jgi:hypothetical protein
MRIQLSQWIIYKGLRTVQQTQGRWFDAVMLQQNARISEQVLGDAGPIH